MTVPLLPEAFWFRPGLLCPLVEAIPRAAGRLLDLPESCRLPRFSQLSGDEGFADVRVAWNRKGLGVVVDVARPDRSAGRGSDVGDGVELWIDTRDTRDVHRATKFCHHFACFMPGVGRVPGAEATIVQQPINRALASPPGATPKAIRSWSDRTRSGWRLEVFFTAAALNGFEPDTNRRLGFYYQVIDAGLGDQFLGVGREFPIGEDPSLWSVLELREGA